MSAAEKTKKPFQTWAWLYKEPMLKPPELLITPRFWQIFQLHPDSTLGQNLGTGVSLTTCPPFSPLVLHSFMGIKTCCDGYPVLQGKGSRHVLGARGCTHFVIDTAFSTLNVPMNLRREALPNPIFSSNLTVPLQWRLFFQIHFLFV